MSPCSTITSTERVVEEGLTSGAGNVPVYVPLVASPEKDSPLPSLTVHSTGWSVSAVRLMMLKETGSPGCTGFCETLISGLMQAQLGAAMSARMNSATALENPNRLIRLQSHA